MEKVGNISIILMTFNIKLTNFLIICLGFCHATNVIIQSRLIVN